MVATICLLFTSCKEKEPSNLLSAENLPSEFQKKLITAEPGDVIELPEGQFDFKRSISLNDIPNVTIKGAGKGKTILSFKNQIDNIILRVSEFFERLLLTADDQALSPTSDFDSLEFCLPRAG